VTIETTEAHAPTPLIPAFEGQPVDASALRMSNSAALELDDVVLKMDDIIQIVVEARVTSVNHIVHESSGRLLRVHTAKALGAHLTPFNEEYDNGVDPA
jgi:hypothetical protein